MFTFRGGEKNCFTFVLYIYIYIYFQVERKKKKKGFLSLFKRDIERILFSFSLFEKDRWLFCINIIIIFFFFFEYSDSLEYTNFKKLLLDISLQIMKDCK